MAADMREWAGESSGFFFFFLSNQGVTCCHGDILKWLWRSGVVVEERQLGKIAWEAKYERALEG